MKKNMKWLFIGVLLGMVIAAPIAWAASRVTLVQGNGTAVGTTANPLTVTIQ